MAKKAKKAAFACHPDKEAKLKKAGKWEEYEKALSGQKTYKQEKKAEDRDTK